MTKNQSLTNSLVKNEDMKQRNWNGKFFIHPNNPKRKLNICVREIHGLGHGCMFEVGLFWGRYVLTTLLRVRDVAVLLILVHFIWKEHFIGPIHCYWPCFKYKFHSLKLPLIILLVSEKFLLTRDSKVNAVSRYFNSLRQKIW